MNEPDYISDFSWGKEKELVTAIVAGDTSTISQLAAQGVNLNALGLCENTPLRVAIEAGQKKAMECLLKSGADVNFKTPGGSSAAEAAVTSQRDPEYLKMLLDFGLDPNTKSGETPLVFFAESEGNWLQYDMLLAKGTDINSRDGDGSSLLLALVMRLEYDRAKDLVLKGADLRAVSITGLNVLDEVVDYQRRFCNEPNLADCRKRAELLRLMQQRGIAIPPGLPYL